MKRKSAFYLIQLVQDFDSTLLSKCKKIILKLIVKKYDLILFEDSGKKHKISLQKSKTMSMNKLSSYMLKTWRILLERCCFSWESTIRELFTLMSLLFWETRTSYKYADSEIDRRERITSADNLTGWKKLSRYRQSMKMALWMFNELGEKI